jgi:diadenosine tetraphosphatase ApaH/serine/threonine PP2A family protein phosphatase
MLLVDSPPSHYTAVLDGVTADAVVLGHTHMPFDRLFDRRRIVNPGSVGMPYGHDGAAWALLGPGVELRRTRYDTAAAARRLAESPWHRASAWTDEYVLHRYSDLEALSAFTPKSKDTDAAPYSS